jgi:hypothetical protein
MMAGNAAQGSPPAKEPKEPKRNKQPADPKEGPDGSLFLIAILLTTLVLGFFVLIFKSDYRVAQIAATNQDYYPQISLDRGP